jgi:hypothetical protein
LEVGSASQQEAQKPQEPEKQGAEKVRTILLLL